jgi:hypothetical protein
MSYCQVIKDTQRSARKVARETGKPGQERTMSTSAKNAIHMVWLPVNQAYAVMWNDHILSIHNDKADAIYEVERLTAR